MHTRLSTISINSEECLGKHESFLKQASLKGVRAEQTEQLRSAYEVVGWSGFIRKQLEELQRLAAKQDVPAVLFVKLYLSLGQKDEAFGWLEKSFDCYDLWTLQFKIDPAYDNLRGDPRYAKLVQKIGLQP